jgi:RimJ/RimL family protein N-acetyltransferase
MRMIAAAAAVTDGGGTSRVAALLEDKEQARAGWTARDLRFRDAGDEDVEMIWLWRNEPATRAMSQSRDPVIWPQHRSWFDRVKGSNDVILLIAEAEAEPIAVLRFDRLSDFDQAFEVSINIRPDRRGGGVGRIVLDEGCRFLFRTKGPARLEAMISDCNPASRRIFESLGFSRQERLGEQAFARYVRPEGAADGPHY